jgi:hypothetical protein
MSVSYPKPSKVKPQRGALLPVAPTPALRAKVALADAQRFAWSAIAQVFFGVMFLTMTLYDVKPSLGYYGIVVGATAQFFCLGAAMWASAQGHSFGRPAYRSGQNTKLGRAELGLLIAIGAIVAGSFALLVADFLSWQAGASAGGIIGIVPRFVSALIFLVLAVFMVLRAIAALKFASAQVTQSYGPIAK